MLKKLMITTALSGVMVGAAFAEGTPSRPADSPPAAQSTPATPAPAPAPAAKPADVDAAKSSEASKPADAAKSAEMSKPAGASSAKFINSQKSDQFLASNFKGTDVVGPDDKKIGDISDILFDKSGKIEAYVVSVGGFLGIGSKHVALEPAAFTVVAGDKSKNESDKLKVALGQEELKQAANFEPYKAPQQTTGMGGAPGGTRPAPTGAPR
jgi:sporulation protein YlmC with PRC-barrel domain